MKSIAIFKLAKPFFFIAGSFLIGLALCGEIDLTWIWVSSPTWAAVSSIVVVLLVAAIIINAIF